MENGTYIIDKQFKKRNPSFSDMYKAWLNIHLIKKINMIIYLNTAFGS